MAPFRTQVRREPNKAMTYDALSPSASAASTFAYQHVASFAAKAARIRVYASRQTSAAGGISDSLDIDRQVDAPKHCVTIK